MNLKWLITLALLQLSVFLRSVSNQSLGLFISVTSNVRLSGRETQDFLSDLQPLINFGLHSRNFLLVRSSKTAFGDSRDSPRKRTRPSNQSLRELIAFLKGAQLGMTLLVMTQASRVDCKVRALKLTQHKETLLKVRASLADVFTIVTRAIQIKSFRCDQLWTDVEPQRTAGLLCQIRRRIRV